MMTDYARDHLYQYLPRALSLFAQSLCVVIFTQAYTVLAESTVYHYGNNSKPLLKRIGDQAHYLIYHSTGRPLGINMGTDPHYLLSDHLGSTWVVIDKTGAVLERYAYAPFGQTTVLSGAGQIVYRYTGQEQDSETETYNYRARHYDASVRQFLSRDPIPSGASPYIYVDNNPVMYLDPTGKMDGPFDMGEVEGARAGMPMGIDDNVSHYEPRLFARLKRINTARPVATERAIKATNNLMKENSTSTHGVGFETMEGADVALLTHNEGVFHFENGYSRGTIHFGLNFSESHDFGVHSSESRPQGMRFIDALRIQYLTAAETGGYPGHMPASFQAEVLEERVIAIAKTTEESRLHAGKPLDDLLNATQSGHMYKQAAEHLGMNIDAFKFQYTYGGNVDLTIHLSPKVNPGGYEKPGPAMLPDAF